MANIYRMAETVIVWLGPASSQTRHTVNAFRIRAAHQFDDTQPPLALRDRLNAHLRGGEAGSSEIGAQERVDHEYWTRRWVVQENAVAKAPKVLWGTSSLLDIRESRTFLGHLKMLRLHHGSDHRLVGGVDHWLRVLEFAAWQRSSTFKGQDSVKDSVKVLEDCRTLRCLDPRDQLYALIGIFPEMFEGLPLNCEEDLSLTALRLVLHVTDQDYIIKNDPFRFGFCNFVECLVQATSRQLIICTQCFAKLWSTALHSLWPTLTETHTHRMVHEMSQSVQVPNRAVTLRYSNTRWIRWRPSETCRRGNKTLELLSCVSSEVRLAAI
jgi:hypothetical protein